MGEHASLKCTECGKVTWFEGPCRWCLTARAEKENCVCDEVYLCRVCKSVFKRDGVLYPEKYCPKCLDRLEKEDPELKPLQIQKVSAKEYCSGRGHEHPLEHIGGKVPDDTRIPYTLQMRCKRCSETFEKTYGGIS